MFDTEFEDIYLHHQFPKTDINFYMNANNSYLLQPWNKTTYKIRPQSKHIKQRIISKTRNLSFDQSSRRIKPPKRKSNDVIKNQITLSTLTFYLSVQNKNNPISRKKNVVSPILRSRRLNHNNQQRVNKSPSDSIFVAQNMSNKGLTSTLRHHNILKLKQERQNKMRQIINKKQLSNKKGSVIKLNRFPKNTNFNDYQNNSQQISSTNIVLGEQPRPLNSYDYIKKPKKASFVGIRKVMNMNNINLQDRSQ